MTEPTSFYLNRATCHSLDLPTQITYAASHHIESFNTLYDQGLARVCQYLPPFTLSHESLPFRSLSLSLDALEIGRPVSSNAPLLPSECRLAGSTYSAPLIASFTRTLDGQTDAFKLNLSDIPLMVRSKHCHLFNKS